MNRSFVQILLSALALVLQLGAAQLSIRLDGRFQLLDFGLATAALAAIATVLGAASGVVLALLLVHPVGKGNAARQRAIQTALIVGTIPFIGVIANLLFSVSPRIFPFSFLRPASMAFADWAFGSPIPSIWLGLVIGWMIRTRMGE